MALNRNAEPGSADWWMLRLVRKILDGQSRYDTLECYVTGNHPYPSGERRYVKALQEFQKMCRTNYYGLITMSPVERMRKNGIKFGSADEADSEAAEMWEENDGEFLEMMVHLYAATFGHSFGLVSPPDEDSNGQPIFTLEDPRMCAIEPDPARRSRSIAGLRMWEDIYTERVVGILHINSPTDNTHYYVGPKVSELRDLPYELLTRRLSGLDETGWELADVKTNIVPVPIVEYPWNPSLASPLAEAEGLIDIQDRINATILDRMIITRSQAYKQRYATGVNLNTGKGRGGNRKPPFDPGSDILWMVEDADATFGEFREADIRQILEAVQQDVGDMSAISKTPPHYLLGKIVNASGDALKASEAGFVSKVKLRSRSMGWGHEKLTKLGFAYLGNPKSTQAAKTIWADPEERRTSELADAGLKYTQMGVPLALAMEKMQFDPAQIKFAVAEQKKQQMREAALAAIGGIGGGSGGAGQPGKGAGSGANGAKASGNSASS